MNLPLSIFSCPSDQTNVNGRAVGGPFGDKWGLSNYSYNHVLFGSGGAVTGLGKSSNFKIGGIPDGASNTLGLGEQISRRRLAPAATVAKKPIILGLGAPFGTQGLAGRATYGPYLLAACDRLGPEQHAAFV